MPDLVMGDSGWDNQYLNPGRATVFYSPFPAQLQSYDPINADLILEPQALDLDFGAGVGGNFRRKWLLSSILHFHFPILSW